MVILIIPAAIHKLKQDGREGEELIGSLPLETYRAVLEYAYQWLNNTTKAVVHKG